MIYFTADTHFYHSNIIKYCNRPFKNIEEMNETLIRNWNSIVKPNDSVYVIGDFVWTYNKNAINNILYVINRLNGYIYLIKGSHDFFERNDLEMLGAETKKLKIYKDSIVIIKIKDKEIVLCHYSMRVWPKSHYGSWHLFGHTHGKLGGWGKSFDVGVDCWDYSPLSFDEVVETMNRRPENFDLIKN